MLHIITGARFVSIHTTTWLKVPGLTVIYREIQPMSSSIDVWANRSQNWVFTCHLESFIIGYDAKCGWNLLVSVDNHYPCGSIEPDCDVEES